MAQAGLLGDGRQLAAQIARARHGFDQSRQLPNRLGRADGRFTGGTIESHFGEEERRPHLENPTDIEKLACADALEAAFIFLDLMQGDAERPRQLRLAHVTKEPRAADAHADVLVD